MFGLIEIYSFFVAFSSSFTHLYFLGLSVVFVSAREIVLLCVCVCVSLCVCVLFLANDFFGSEQHQSCRLSVCQHHFTVFSFFLSLSVKSKWRTRGLKTNLKRPDMFQMHLTCCIS